MSFRDSIGRYSPPWLQRKWGERYLYDFGLMADAIAEAAREGVRARAPGAPGTPADALPQIGADRVIRRGFVEALEGYADRLRYAFADWHRAAQREGELRQVQALFLPDGAGARWVTEQPIADALVLYADIPSNGAPIAYSWSAKENWHWGSAGWARAFLVIRPGPAQWQTAALGGGWTLGAPRTIGTTATVEEIASLRATIAAWKSAATIVHPIVVWDLDDDAQIPAHAWAGYVATVGDLPADWPNALEPDGSPYYPGNWGLLGLMQWDGTASRPVRYAVARYLMPVT